MEIWVSCKSNSVLLRGVKRYIKFPDLIAKGSLVKSHLKKYWAARALNGAGNCCDSMTRCVGFIKIVDTQSMSGDGEWL